MEEYEIKAEKRKQGIEEQGMHVAMGNIIRN